MVAQKQLSHSSNATKTATCSTGSAVKGVGSWQGSTQGTKGCRCTVQAAMCQHASILLLLWFVRARLTGEHGAAHLPVLASLCN